MIETSIKGDDGWHQVEYNLPQQLCARNCTRVCRVVQIKGLVPRPLFYTSVRCGLKNITNKSYASC